jgi:hypothetical protein
MIKPVRDPRSLVKVTLSFVDEDEHNLKENFENLSI